ncbi:MAG: nodulation protein NfeD [Anaerolineales bacterium]|nr:nodulation protein NfeD [Anaerolineales bacterium]
MKLTVQRMFGWLLGVVLVTALLLGGAAGAQAERNVYALRAEGPITPAMAEYLERGIRLAEEDNAEALVFQLDTPGGAIDTMNRMVQAIRGSRVPVIVYVAPRGAIAGSAGTVITLAGHAAAMAPETAIGAASPVGGQGEDLGETIEQKAKEILKATVRSLAARRGEDAVELAEATIEEARAASAEEALEVGLVDLIADDLQELLLQIDGTTVEVAGAERTLNTRDAAVVEVDQSFIEQLLQAMTNPALVFLLLAVGVQSVLIELSNPGGWIAGFVGVVCLALAGYGLGILPVNWFGLIFVVTAFVLFLLEISTPTYGALAAAGLGSLILGALVLFNSPGAPGFLRVSIPAVVSIALLTGGTFLLIVGFALRAQRKPATTGAEGLVGRTAVVRSRLAPSGTVRIAGELWAAELEDGAPEQEVDEQVEVVGVDRLRLIVKPRPEDRID